MPAPGCTQLTLLHPAPRSLPPSSSTLPRPALPRQETSFKSFVIYHKFLERTATISSYFSLFTFFLHSEQLYHFTILNFDGIISQQGGFTPALKPIEGNACALFTPTAAFPECKGAVNKPVTLTYSWFTRGPYGNPKLLAPWQAREGANVTHVPPSTKSFATMLPDVTSKLGLFR